MHTETGEALDRVGAQCGIARQQGEGDATYRARIISTGGPAFGEFKQAGECSIKTGGITVRDYFAAKATDGDVSDVRHTYYMTNGHKPDFAALSQAQARYMHADAMLAARGE